MKKWTLLALILIVIPVSVGIIGCSSSDKAANEQQAEGQLWTCGMHPEVILDEPGNCPICGMELVPVKGSGGAQAGHETQQHEHQSAEAAKGDGDHSQHNMEASEQKAKTQTGKEKKKRKILYWRAPMDPTEIYDRPGKSKMGMDLIPVYEDEAELGSGGVVKIDPEIVQQMGVRTTEVKKMDFHRVIRTVGYIDYNEEKLYTVSPKISGWIDKLYVDFTGQEVRTGQPLLEIYSPELVTTQEEYLLALKNKQALQNASFKSIQEGAESLLKASYQRLRYWDIPESEIRRLETTRQVRKTLQLQSPANGVVIHKNAVEGSFVKEGMPLYQIADLSTVWVYASIYDYELPWLDLGNEATMDLSYYPGKSFTGKIIYIYPYLDKKARVAKIRMEFSNPNLELKPGMYSNVIVKGRVIPDALVIPSEAVIRSGVRNIVFVARGKGKFEPRQVKLGEEGENGLVRVISGLLPGEKVVTSAQFLLDSESRLQEAIQKLLQERMKKGASAGKQAQPPATQHNH